MTLKYRHLSTALVLSTACCVTLLNYAPPAGAFISSKLTFFGAFGQEVDRTQVELHSGFEKENVCLAESGDTCKFAKEGAGPGAFVFPEGVAAGPVSSSGDVYVSDKINSRIQVFSPTGVFVSMWGWDVNKTKTEEVSATQAERDVCTSAELKAGDVCQKGQPAISGPAGQIAKPTSIVVSQSTGDVYVLDFTNHRIEKYTSTGVLLWMLGGDVNKTKVEQAGASEAEQDLCVEGSGDICQTGVERTDSTKPHALKPGNFLGDLLALGLSAGKEVLYLGDEGRILEFDAESGIYKTEKPPGPGDPTGFVTALAVDAGGHLYVIYKEPSSSTGTGVRVLEPTGVQAREIDATHDVSALALDPFGRLAVLDNQTRMGVLFNATDGVKLSEFGPAGGFSNLDVAFGFNLDPSESQGQIYVAREFEVEVFRPVPVVNPATGTCKSISGTSITFTGEANPNGVEETKVWFEYGTDPTVLTSRTSTEELLTGSALVPIETFVGGLRPNQTYFFRLAGEDRNYKPTPEEQPIIGETESCGTEYLGPVSNEAPVSYYVTFSSAVLSTNLSPENARTVYYFEYWPCEKPEAAHLTAPLESSEYATIDVVQGVSELQPSTEYCYGLVAESENEAKTMELATRGPTGRFATAAAPKPTAITDFASNETTTSATLVGTFNPDGANATYSILVGVYQGAQTVYGTVMTGLVSGGSGTTSKAFELTGLEPGVTYAYVAKITSPYGSVVGMPVLFKTVSVPTVQAPGVVALIPSPIGFPKSGLLKKKPKIKVSRKRQKKKKKKK